MKSTVWAVADAKRQVWFVEMTRTVAQATAQHALGDPWKALYREGWRCVRATLIYEPKP